MAQSLEEQIAVVERSLAECMIDTAWVIVRAWLNEIGENNPYEEAFVSIQTHYRDWFSHWLNIEDPHHDEQLSKLTGEAFALVDAVYADIRLKRGLSPQMHGFNGDSAHSVMHYFENCVRFRPEDLEWFHELMNDESRAEIAMVAITALSLNLRSYFNADALLAMIDGINGDNEMASGMCTAHAMMLLAQYDSRIDFFPHIQDAFANTIAENDLSDPAFDLLCGLIRNEQAMKLLPGANNDGYLAQVVPIIPQTWLYALLIEGSTERERKFAYYCMQGGYCEQLWDYPDLAEQVFVNKLREGTDKPMDYIHYAHSLLLQGDRMMAFENYKQARQLCGSSKEFFNLFRPDRKQLVEHGVPIEHVYMIEDHLING